MLRVYFDPQKTALRGVYGGVKQPNTMHAKEITRSDPGPRPRTEYIDCLRRDREIEAWKQYLMTRYLIEVSAESGDR